MLSDSIVTTLTAAPTLDLTTLDRAKQELGITGTASDSLISAWIHEVSQRISSACSRTFGLEQVEEDFDPTGPDHHHFRSSSRVLRLSRWPVTEVESVTLVTSDTTTLLTAVTDYAVDLANGLIYRVSQRWHGQIRVIYDAGYTLVTGLPYDLEAAALLLLRYRQSAASRDPMIRSQTVVDVMSVSYWGGPTPATSQVGNLPQDVVDLLQPYISPTIA